MKLEIDAIELGKILEENKKLKEELIKYKKKDIGLSYCYLVGLTEENGAPYGNNLHFKNSVIIGKEYFVENFHKLGEIYSNLTSGGRL